MNYVNNEIKLIYEYLIIFLSIFYNTVALYILKIIIILELENQAL